MFNVLNAFAAGIMFSVGVCVGALLCRLASKQGQKDLQEELRNHGKRVEDRLAKYVEHTAVLSSAAQKWMNEKD